MTRTKSLLPLPDTGLHYVIHHHYVEHGTPPVRKMAARGGQAQRPRWVSGQHGGRKPIAAFLLCLPYRHAPPSYFSHGQRACVTTSIERLRGTLERRPLPRTPTGDPLPLLGGLAPSPPQRADNHHGAALDCVATSPSLCGNLTFAVWQPHLGCVTPSRSLVVAAGGFERRPAPRAPWASVFHDLLPHGGGSRPWVVLAPLRSCP